MSMKIYDLDKIILETDVIELLEALKKMERRIIDRVPDEIIFTATGTPNTNNKWGAALYHIRLMRATMNSLAGGSDE